MRRVVWRGRQFVRRRPIFGVREAAWLAGGTVLIFFTHLIPAAITVLSIVAIAVWTFVLIGIYAAGLPVLEWKPNLLPALEDFPQYFFATAARRIGGQNVLAPAVLFFLFGTIVALRRREWRSAKGAVAAAAAGCFALYLLVPNEGLGGGEAMIRFAWAVFLVGGIAAESASRRPLEKALMIYMAVLLSCNLFVTWRAIQSTSRAVEDYIAATDRIPRGAVFFRIHYSTRQTTERYGLASMGRDPFFHLDAYRAYREGSIDASDYEGLNPIFPVGLRPRVGEAQRNSLWALEGPDENTAQSLAFLRDQLFVPIDYVVLVSDPGADREQAAVHPVIVVSSDAYNSTRAAPTGSAGMIEPPVGDGLWSFVKWGGN
jgi:hypothetical protein